MHALVKTTEKYDQDSYAASARAVQSEWVSLQCMMKYMGQTFAGLEKVLQETFLPCLFFGKYKTLPSVIGYLNMLPLKRSGM